MPEKFDVIVIGSGIAGQTVLSRLHGSGRRVALAETRELGGTCPLRGCDPKKVLLGAADAVDAADRMRGHGVAADIRVAWNDLARFKRSFTEPVSARIESLLSDQGVRILRGVARFVAPDALEVDGQTFEAKHFVIASGAAPIPLGIEGEELVASSEDFLDLLELPERIVMIGGGYIASEFSHIAARAGAKVTVLESAARLLPQFDGDMVGILAKSFDDLGITVRTGTAVTGVERQGRAFRVTARRADGSQLRVEADLVVHTAGRRPALQALDLDKAEVAVKDGRLQLDRHLNSVSNPRVYAAGDSAAAGPPLTPISAYDGGVVAKNLLEGPGAAAVDYRGVPNVAFTIPPIAAVGMDEESARARYPDLKVHTAATPDWFTARRLNVSSYGHKVLVDGATDRIVGAHLVGPHADEVINLFAVAIRNNLTAQALRSTILTYPTSSSDIASMLG